MTWLPAPRPASGLGRPLFRLAAAAAAAGGAAALAGLASGRAGTVLAALAAGWLFFAGLAAGAVAFAAAVRVAHGAWAEALLPAALAGAGFFGPAAAVLAVLALGAGVLGSHGPGGAAAFAARQILAGVLVFAAGARFASRAGDPPRARPAGWAYLAACAAGLSLWAFGFALEPAGRPALAVVPAWYFTGAFLSGIAWVALLAALRGLGGPEARHDLGKLLFAFAALWSYLVWALYLPGWYGNLADESAFLLPRWSGPWRPAAAAVLVAAAAVPLALLLPARHKRRRGTLGAGAASALLGLWGAQQLLVLPSFRIGSDPWTLLLGAAVAAGTAGLFLLSVGGALGQGRPAAAPGETGQARAGAGRR